jgi:transposase
MTEAYDGRRVVGMDLHRRRGVLVRMTGDGRRLETVRMENSPAALRAVLARAGKNPRVVVEAAYGWYWAAGVLRAAGAEVHLAHRLGVMAFSCRRVKNDERDARDLADLLRMGRLPGAWIAPRAVRALREVTRHRRKGGRVPHLVQGPGARGAGHVRYRGAALRHLRPVRIGVAGPAGAAGAVRGQGGLAARPDRRAGR